MKQQILQGVLDEIRDAYLAFAGSGDAEKAEAMLQVLKANLADDKHQLWEKK